MNGVYDWLRDNSLELIGLLATLTLLLVTWLATKASQDMAKTARDAAAESARATEAAERSAQAAWDAARVAQSQIKVDFEARAISVATNDGESIPSVEIKCTGDAVVVQRVQVRRAFRQGDDEFADSHLEPDLTGVDLLPVGETLVPSRLHPGERQHFTHPAMEKHGDRLSRYLLYVVYTFHEDGGEGGRREVTFSVR